MLTKSVKLGKDDLLFSEISIMEELEAKNLYRTTWKSTHHLMAMVDEEGERLACCAFMIKKRNGKDLTPLEAFDYILSLPKKLGDQIRLEFSNMNDVNNFFDIVAQMVKGSSGNDSSSKSSEGSITSGQETLPEVN